MFIPQNFIGSRVEVFWDEFESSWRELFDDKQHLTLQGGGIVQALPWLQHKWTATARVRDRKMNPESY